MSLGPGRSGRRNGPQVEQRNWTKGSKNTWATHNVLDKMPHTRVGKIAWYGADCYARRRAILPTRSLHEVRPRGQRAIRQSAFSMLPHGALPTLRRIRSLHRRFNTPIWHEPHQRNDDIERDRYPWLKKRKRRVGKECRSRWSPYHS